MGGSASEALKARIPRITKLVTITENNDPNDMIGRPSGFIAAVVLFDAWTTGSDGLEASYGATIEQWRTPADAKARMDYIQGILKGMTVSGIQYDYLRAVDSSGSTALKPTAAATYKSPLER